MHNYIYLLIALLGIFMKNPNFKELPFAKYFVFSISTLILFGGLGLASSIVITSVAHLIHGF